MASQPQVVISEIHQLNDTGKRAFDRLIALGLFRNDSRRLKAGLIADGDYDPMPEIDDAIRDNFWKRVFADGWATDQPNIIAPMTNMTQYMGMEVPLRATAHVFVGKLSDTTDYDDTKATYQGTDVVMAAKPDFQSDFVDFKYSYRSGSVYSSCEKRRIFKEDSMNQPSQILEDKVRAIHDWDEAQMERFGEWNYRVITYVARRNLVELTRYFVGDENGVLCSTERHPSEIPAEQEAEDQRTPFLIESCREYLKRTRVRLLDKVASFNEKKNENEGSHTGSRAYGLTYESNEPEENSEELHRQLQCIKELAETTELLAKVVMSPPPANIWQCAL
ncbi:hypothetical protein CSIM01_02473 [Colletotrichum simmondsii]|uniref:Uncharacterized protein n=1 Tax=Colletotrichum simmondsii TaxID=703756 RepID=A0A135S7V6_9PEZI|nr:hypothetical protein CSIM01_02473 [Colletotrichum simmondsii]